MSRNARSAKAAPAPAGLHVSCSTSPAPPGAEKHGLIMARQDAPSAALASRLTALRGNCMGAAVLLIVQFGIGIGVNLYVTLPNRKSFLPAVFSSAVLAAHAIVALWLLGTATAALVRAIRARRAIGFTSAALVAILAAGVAGAAFVGNPGNGASLAMALATAAAMLCYMAAVFSLR
jgi:hypothetical protein